MSFADMSLADTAGTVGQDLRRSLRSLVRSPGFTAAAFLTLALGIGANAAIFTILNAVLLKPLPYGQPESQVMIWSRWTGFDKTWVSIAEVLDYRTRTTTLSDVAAWGVSTGNLTGDGDPQHIGLGGVTANTFAVLGVAPPPGLGRTFHVSENVPGQDQVIILSHELWRQRYAADPAIVGKTLQLNGRTNTIVGVMPAGFRLPTDFSDAIAEPTAAWVPLPIDTATVSGNRGNHSLYAAARLKPGVTAAQANEELRAVTQAMTNEGLYPQAMKFTAIAVPMEEQILGGVRPAVLLLSGAVGFLLLIACANVASLLLARAEGRQREMALRTALGASEWRLVRQVLTEGLVLAVVSAIGGLMAAVLGLRLLLAIDPTMVPNTNALTVDGRVLAFVLLLALVSTVLFSLAPALRALRLDLVEALKEGGHQGTIGVRRQRVRSTLVVVQMALAVILAVGAMLMVRSLWALQQIDLGFNPERVLTLRLSLPESSYAEPPQIVGFYARLLERVRTLPDVRHAGLVRALPLANTIGDWGLDIEGYVEPPGQNAKGDWQVTSDGAAEALGERLVSGRFFRSSDTSDAPLVAVINETMATLYWPNGNALGGRIRMGSNVARPWLTVVGIVHDQRHNGIDAIVKEKFYVPYSQFHLANGNSVRGLALVIKTTGDPLNVAAPIRTLVRQLDPNLPIASVRTMDDIVSMSIATPRFTGWLLALFAGLAVVLASIGIYGVLAYLVSQRTHEIGIRMAIGASSRNVLRMVLARGLVLALMGIGSGLVGAWFLTTLMAGLLHDVQSRDPLTFAGVAIVLTVVALAASYLPARRATRVDPLKALRAD